ncbi:MAG TPA: hypothetical protein VEC16_01750 [Alphaproteobacteria bacterium]|nr:hypothetical protein [Alphaproteobacteria bacterium]
MAKSKSSKGSTKESNKDINKEVAKELLKQITESSKEKSGKEDKKDSKSNSKNDPLKELSHVKEYYYLTPDDNISIVGMIHKVMETLEVYLKTIQQILQPEEFHALYECNAFDDKEKSDLFTIYKKAIIMHRELLKALIENDEKKSIAAVKKIHEESLQIKGKMVHTVEKLQKSWKLEPEKRRSVHYFG